MEKNTGRTNENDIENRTSSAIKRESAVTEYNINDIVILKKKHPCGADSWKILRTGMDFRIECTKCGHQLLLPRKSFLKAVKCVQKVNSEN